MTILCLALGNPAPTISLYVGGHLVRQDTSRHMVTVINNVTTDMEHVSCYADNGYGIPMQASKKIHISCEYTYASYTLCIYIKYALDLNIDASYNSCWIYWIFSIYIILCWKWKFSTSLQICKLEIFNRYGGANFHFSNYILIFHSITHEISSFSNATYIYM